MSRPGRPSTWRLVAEALASIASRPGLTTTLAGVVAAAAIATTWIDADSLGSARSADERLRQSGYTTLVIEHDDAVPGRFAASSCQAVGSLRGVLAAVSLGSPEVVRLWSANGPEVPVRRASRELVTLLTVSEPSGMRTWGGAQVFVDAGSSVAGAEGEAVRVALVVDGALSVTAAHTVSLGALGGGSSGNAVVIDATMSTIEACAVAVEMAARDDVAADVALAFDPLRGYSQRWALSGADVVETGRARFESRIGRNAWVAAAALFAVLWMVYLRLRRADLAFYAVLGLRPRHLTVVLLVELAVVVAFGCGFAAIAFSAAADRSGSVAAVRHAGFAALWRTALGCWSIGVWTTWFVAGHVHAAALAALKDR